MAKKAKKAKALAAARKAARARGQISPNTWRRTEVERLRLKLLTGARVEHGPGGKFVSLKERYNALRLKLTAA